MYMGPKVEELISLFDRSIGLIVDNGVEGSFSIRKHGGVVMVETENYTLVIDPNKELDISIEHRIVEIRYFSVWMERYAEFGLLLHK